MRPELDTSPLDALAAADLLTVANLRHEEYRDALEALSKANLLTDGECWTADRGLRDLARLHERKQVVA